MKKNDFVSLVANKTGFTKKDTEKTLDAILEAVGEVLATGDKLQLMGFGSFETKFRCERSGRHPKTGEPTTIAAATVPVFKAGSQLKEKVNQQ